MKRRESLALNIRYVSDHKHTTQLPLNPLIEAAWLVAGGKEVEIEVTGSISRWSCRNCGDDHGYSTCDNPDFHRFNQYRIPGDPKPGKYLLIKLDDEEEE